MSSSSSLLSPTPRFERLGRVVVILGALGFSALVARSAAHKIFWYDEIYTVLVARQAGPAAIWQALLHNVDNNPPLIYLLTRASVRLFGETPLAVRLPSLVSFAVFLACLYRFAARSGGPGAGLLTVLVLLAGETVVPYAYEARPYAMMLAFAASGLMFWQRAWDVEGSPWVAPVGLALSLALALSSHYYAILLFVPLTLGELVRSWAERRLDLRVWGALAVGGSTLLAYLPLTRAARRYAAGFWAAPAWHMVLEFNDDLIAALGTPLLAVLVVLAFSLTIPPRRARAIGPRPLVWETAAAAGFVLLPLVAIALGKLVTGAYTARYALPAVIGSALLFGQVVSALTIGRRIPLVLVLLILGGWAFHRETVRHREFAPAFAAFAENREFLNSHCATGERVLIVDPHLFLLLDYYREGTRIDPVYLASTTAPLRHQAHNTGEKGLFCLAPIAGLNVVDIDQFHPESAFLIFGRNSWLNAWTIPELQARGYRLEPLSEIAKGVLYRATAGTPSTSPAETTDRAASPKAAPAHRSG